MLESYAIYFKGWGGERGGKVVDVVEFVSILTGAL